MRNWNIVAQFNIDPISDIYYLPMRNWNFEPILTLNSPLAYLLFTYEELKPGNLEKEINKRNSFTIYLWGIETITGLFPLIEIS